MKFLAILIFTGIPGLTGYGQTPVSPVKFGDIAESDIKMVYYDKDSTAEAVILTDYGNANFGWPGIKYERHTRIKILREGGLKYADVQIPSPFKRADYVQNLKASTYNFENGKTIETKLTKEGVFLDKFNRGMNILKFTLPNVKVGSIIEYSYEIPIGYFLLHADWQFQSKIPTRWSEYWVFIPESAWTFEKFVQGYVPMDVYEVKEMGNNSAYHWICKNVPAFREEPFMTGEEGYISKLNFSLRSAGIRMASGLGLVDSWKTLNDYLLTEPEFAVIVKHTPFLRKVTERVTTGVTDPLVRMEKIQNFVRDSIEWDKTKSFLGSDPKHVMELKKGSSGEKNLILGSMLNKAGFDVDMVLISTVDHGLVRKEHPRANQFDDVICLVRFDGKNYFIDATEKQLPWNVLPKRCLNSPGWVVSKTFSGWVDLPSTARAKTYVTADLTLDGEGNVSGRLEYNRDGYDAHEMRKLYKEEGERNYLSKASANKAWQIENNQFENVDELNKPCIEKLNLNSSDFGLLSGSSMHFNPFIEGREKENPFKASVRVYPIDFGAPIEKTFFCTIHLPADYEIDELPTSKILSLPGKAGKYVYSIAKAENQIHITSQLVISKSFFSQDDYATLKEFYSQVVAIQEQQISLKHK